MSDHGTYLSADTVIRCLQSLLNFIPVTISETQTGSRMTTTTRNQNISADQLVFVKVSWLWQPS